MKKDLGAIILFLKVLSCTKEMVHISPICFGQKVKKYQFTYQILSKMLSLYCGNYYELFVTYILRKAAKVKIFEQWYDQSSKGLVEKKNLWTMYKPLDISLFKIMYLLFFLESWSSGLGFIIWISSSCRIRDNVKCQNIAIVQQRTHWVETLLVGAQSVFHFSSIFVSTRYFHKISLQFSHYWWLFHRFVYC